MSTISSGSSSSNFLKSLKNGYYQKMKPKATHSNGVESISEEAPLVSNRHVNSPIRNRRPPTDLCYGTYFIFCLLGIGHLLPWNFFITAQSYFEEKFTCKSSNTTFCTSSLKSDFENYFSVAAMSSVCSMTAINIWLQSKIHYKYRMFISLVGILVLFVATTVFVKVDASEWVDEFFALTIVTVVFISVFSAIFQSSTFGFSGVFPPKYTSTCMGGQGIAGILASLALILSKLAASNHPTKSALIYFCIAVVVIILCLGGFFLMLRLKFVKHYMVQTSVEVKKQASIIKNSTNAKLDTAVPFKRIFFDIIMFAMSVFLVFAVTLSLFPSVLSHLKSSSPHPEDSGWTSTYFNPLVCFLLYNSSDFSGRFATNWCHLGKNRFVLLSVAVLRVGLIPLFLLCNVGQGSDSLLPIVFKNDVIPVVLVILLGFTNGYLGSLSMIAGPMSVPPEQRETAATIMVFFLSFGLFFGSSVSFLWTKVFLKVS